MAAQQDWFAADVKVYTTKVLINPDDIEGLNLKPGMSAEVTITIADALEHVLTVPIQAIIGGSEMGANRKIIVMTEEGPKERDIVVGISNTKIAEIKEGLQEGDEVVLNPQAVLGDKIKVHQPGQEKAQSSDQGGNGGGPAKKDGPGGRGKTGPSGKSGPGSGGFGNMTSEEKQKARQQMQEKFRKASPEERKQMLQDLPEGSRERVKASLQGAGITIPD